MKQVLEQFVSLGFNPATVIDVGVAKGTPELYTSFPKARHLLIEPLREFEKDLKDICKKYNAQYVLAAASANPGKMEIAVASDFFGSSFLYDDKDIIRREVPVVTINGACEERGLHGPFLLKADVQGAEIQVLDGANAILKDTEVVILEVSFFRFAQGAPEFYEVVDYMKNKGFVVYDIFGGHNRPLDGAKAQTDIAFVKENGRFRSSHAWGTNKQITEWDKLSK
jgi:FkbM family methyltransferase